MAIPAPVPTPVTLPESHSSMMDIDVREEGEQHMLEARDGHEPAMKKLKRVHGEVEMVLRQTAEIVMVLVGVAALRGGAQPSPLECQLAAEAYEKLATLVAVSAPQDLVSKDALQSLIQQLTVPPPPARLVAPKPVSIQSQASRVSAPAASGPSPVPSPVSKAPAQAPPAQATTTPSPSPSPSLSPLPSPAPVSLSNASAPPVSVASSAPTSESVAPPPAADAAPASKAVTAAPKTVSPTPSPALGKTKALEDVQTSGPALDNSAAPSATPSSVPATNTNIPVATSATPSNTPKIKPEGWTSPVRHQGTPSAAAQPTTTTATTTTTTTTTVVIKDQRGNQAPKALARQRGLKNLVNNEPPPVAVLDPQQTHRQLALAVHLLLKPLIISPGLGKAAMNYMSVSVPCGICKVVVNTTNSCLVCDGCEGGFHLQCLQLSSSQSLPKSDWYCPKCVTTNAGRPQPPKYGPLRKGPAGPPGPKNSWAMQAGCGSDSSKGQTPGKLLLQSRKKEGDASQVPALETCSTPNPEEAVAREPDMDEHQAPTTSVTFEQETEPEKQPAQVGAVDDSIVTVEWVGPVVSTSQDKLYYSACSVGGETLRLQDTAFFRPEAPDVPPYIARLQALWEDKSSGQKWVKVNWCYNPSDLPVNMGRPVISDPREVYESNHSDNNLVGSIQGPCLVLSPLQYQEEMERRSKNSIEDPMPLFLCQWFYDAPRGLFRASSDAVS